MLTYHQEFVGTRLYPQFVPQFLRRNAKSGKESFKIIESHPGISYERYLELGGSSNRLRRMVNKECAVDAV